MKGSGIRQSGAKSRKGGDILRSEEEEGSKGPALHHDKKYQNWYTIDALGAIFAIFTILDTFTILLQYFCNTFYKTFTILLQYFYIPFTILLQ